MIPPECMRFQRKICVWCRGLCAIPVSYRNLGYWKYAHTFTNFKLFTSFCLWSIFILTDTIIMRIPIHGLKSYFISIFDFRFPFRKRNTSFNASICLLLQFFFLCVIITISNFFFYSIIQIFQFSLFINRMNLLWLWFWFWFCFISFSCVGIHFFCCTHSFDRNA